MKLLAAGVLLAVAVIAASALLVFGDGESGTNVGNATVASAAEVSASGTFRTRPNFNPPTKVVKTSLPAAAGGKILIGSKEAGAGIYTSGGEPIWFRPGVIMDFRVQRYRGKRVLTWYQKATKGSGLKRSTYIIADRNYRIIKKVRPGNGLDPDSHEFRLTSRGTALVSAYRTRQGFNLSRYGLGTNAPVLESIAQEVDVRTGRVIWQWNSLDHVPVRDTYAEKVRRPGAAFDYFHINTVTESRDGNILISGRSTNAMYKISRRTGRVIWTLGGRSSDFKMGKGAYFSSQHDTEQISKNRFSLFDNGGSPVATPVRDQSRGLILQVNFKKKIAKVHRQFFNPAKPLSTQQANMERLAERQLPGRLGRCAADQRVHAERQDGLRRRVPGDPVVLPGLPPEVVRYPEGRRRDGRRAGRVRDHAPVDQLERRLEGPEVEDRGRQLEEVAEERRDPQARRLRDRRQRSVGGPLLQGGRPRREGAQDRLFGGQEVDRRLTRQPFTGAVRPAPVSPGRKARARSVATCGSPLRSSPPPGAAGFPCTA